jgi:hypothetical protein
LYPKKYTVANLPTFSLLYLNISDLKDEDEITDFLLMEDIRKTYGYKMADRSEPLDFAHSKLVVEALAKFHAYSWGYKQRSNLPKLVERFPFLKETFFAGPIKDQFTDMIGNVKKTTLEIIEDVLPSTSLSLQGIKKLLERDSCELMEFFVHPDGIDEVAAEELLRVPHSPSARDGFDNGKKRSQIAQLFHTILKLQS